MRTTAKRCTLILYLGLTLAPVSHGSEPAVTGPSASRQESVSGFNVAAGVVVARSAWTEPVRPSDRAAYSARPRSVGSALSPQAGIGVGESVALTWDDAQYTQGHGRHIACWWNGETGGNAQVDVHFGYRDMQNAAGINPFPMTGYNVYDAIWGGWPRGQDCGCNLQGIDTIGWGGMPSLDMVSPPGDPGRVVMGAMSALFLSYADGTRVVDNMLFYQGSQYNCTYDPRSDLNVTWVDSILYRPHFLDQSEGIYSRDPQVVTQWDGDNTIVHVLLGEDSDGVQLYDPEYSTALTYRTWTYFRKVGDQSGAGTWSAGQIIDSIWFPWVSLTASPISAQVAVTYTNPTFYGAILDHPYDLDVWCRESYDRGLSWQPAQNITNYTNAIAYDYNHFTAWLETQALYTSDGDLHVIWTAKPTSADPYLDGFDWESFDQNIYHWSKYTNEITKVANGSYPILYTELGVSSIADAVCGFGGSNAGFIANINISQCSDKLYCVWNQIHERANRFAWRDAWEQPAPGVLDDCAYTDEFMARANWEIMMSVAWLGSSALWDIPRNVTNTYAPDCGEQGDPEAEGPCGSEYKPSVERYALDETGISLTWPEASIVDLSPGQNYSGSWYLNLLYLDDQFPGPSMWGEWQTAARTFNSIKWIRLACVEPIETSAIYATPERIEWPQWVQTGQVGYHTVTVVNEGNVVLNITEIGTYEQDGGGWLSVSENPTPFSPFCVMAGVVNTATFDIIVDAAGLTYPVWLDGTVWLKSDAANADSLAIPIHLMAADHVEPVVWDTVQSHQYMFDIYFAPDGECVALAVSNHGEMGYLGGGSVNLDFKESGLECGMREEDAIYLRSGSPFTILADDASGSNAQLTCSYNDRNQVQETGWDPTADKGSMTGGLAASGAYDSVCTGRMVNRDTTIAMERTFYAPRSSDPAADIIDFVICYTKVYSGDGMSHSHVTVGNVVDWNVPSERADYNTSGVSGSGFVYVRGTDTTGVLSCQTHSNRYATEAFLYGYTSNEWLSDNCVRNTYYHGSLALPQQLLVDTTHYRNGTPLVPPQPNPEVWWWETMVPGPNGDATAQDQAVWLTYVQNYTLGFTDTLHYWTVLTTVRNGTLSDLQAQVDYARTWHFETIRGCPDYPYTGCWAIGDLDGSGGDRPYPDDMDVSDLVLLGDALYGSGQVLDRPWQADLVVDHIIDTLDLAAMTCMIYGAQNPSGCLLSDYPLPTTCSPRVRLLGQPLVPIGTAAILESPPGSEIYQVSGIGNFGNDGVRFYHEDDFASRSVVFESDSLKLGTTSARMTVVLRGSTETAPVPLSLGSVSLRNTAVNRFEITADYSPTGTSLVGVSAYLDGRSRGVDTVSKGVVVIGESVYGMPEITRVTLNASDPPSVRVDLNLPVKIITQGTPSLEWYADRVVLTALGPTDAVTGYAPSDLKVARIPTFFLSNVGDGDQFFSGTTGAGSNVSVPLGDVVDLEFESVTAGGTTELVVSTTGPPTPAGFQVISLDEPLFYDISTTASYTGTITVCIHYDDTWLTAEEEQALTLLHYEGGQWHNITTSLLTASDVICGQTTSLSQFAVGFSANCCLGRVGDANGQGGDEPTISDISILIDAKFITGTCQDKISCLLEGDVNQSGGSNPTCDDITISDISTLIDYLFITGPETAVLPDCL